MSRYIDADLIEYEPMCRARGNGMYEDCEIAYKDEIDDIPTADVRENVKGEWIEDNSREKSMMWRCSVCGRIAYYPTIGKRKGFKKHCGYHYCPWRDADMRGEV